VSDRDFAVVIGIRDYAHLEVLDGALEDARHVRNWLLTLGEVREDHLRFLVGDGGEHGEPTVAAIEAAFDETLDAARAQGPRRLYVYFAGHGLSPEVSRLSLLAADARMENLGRAIDSKGYEDGLGDLPLFPEQIFWYDCCRFYDRRAQNSSPPKFTHVPPEPPPRFKQMVHYGASFNDAANERPYFGAIRGIFTQALLEGLYGAAARVVHQDAVVVAADLGTFVTRRVEELARQVYLSQIPEPRYIGDANEFVIADSVMPSVQRIEVTVGPGPGELYVRDGKLREVCRQPISDRDEVVVLNLKPGLYQIERAPQQRCEIIVVQPAPAGLAVNLSGS
jgi:Caspase domain